MEMDNLENVVYVIRSLSAVTCDVEVVFHIKICVLTSIGEREIILVMITCSDLIIEKERKHRREGKMEKKFLCESKEKNVDDIVLCVGERRARIIYFLFSSHFSSSFPELSSLPLPLFKAQSFDFSSILTRARAFSLPFHFTTDE